MTSDKDFPPPLIGETYLGIDGNLHVAYPDFLPDGESDYRGRFTGYCPRCGDPARQGINAPDLLCEPCRADLWEKAESYGGTKAEIEQRVVEWLVRSSRRPHH